MGSRRGAFDPARFDTELVDLLDLPVGPAPSGDPRDQPSALGGSETSASNRRPKGQQSDVRLSLADEAVRRTSSAPSASASGPLASRPSGRASGGHPVEAARPPAASSEAPKPQVAASKLPDHGRTSQALGGLRQVAVRIPRPLYEAVTREVLSGVERPSYGQLVAWTAQDHPEEVQKALEALVARPERLPRGRRLAAETVQLTLRVSPGELAEIDRLLEQAGGAEQGVTRTRVVAAALHVAVDRSRA